MSDKQRKTPHEQGIREFFGKKYIWLLNHKGQLELHGLHRTPPSDAEDTDA